ncbi:MAG: hypothetical protein N4A70_17490 [Pelagimonas sp.]|nr:hypothetical protein [Pelagimonas sp.]
MFLSQFDEKGLLGWPRLYVGDSFQENSTFLSGQMSDQSKPYISKHLARNVPEDFNAICERVKHRQMDRGPRFGESGPEYLRRVNRGLLVALWREPSEVDDGTIKDIESRISDIQIRFLAIQKTLDHSVPTKPVYEALNKLSRSVNRTVEVLTDSDRDAVAEFIGSATPDIALNQIFSGSQSLAEKVSFTEQYLRSVQHDLNEMVQFFDYKNGLSGRGNPSKYGLLYAVFALADVFEAHSDGRKATVNETVNTGANGRMNQRRYTGDFLDFVVAFLQRSSPDMLQRSLYEGLCDRIRKTAKARKRDADLHLLLHKDTIEVADTLEFMARADAVK